MKRPFSPNLSALRRRSGLLSGNALWFVGLVVVVAILLLLLRVFLPNALTAVARPFWTLGTSGTSAAQNISSSFQSNASLAADRDRLMQDNASLTESNRVLGVKVADLEKLSGAKEPVAETIVAGVLARPPVSPYDMLVVGAGAKSGVVAGALVYGPGGVPLGTIDTVSPDEARVGLYSAPGRTTDGWIGDAHTPLTITGEGGGSFIATIPHDAGITVGAVVSVPGPGALPMGSVVKVDADPSSPRDTLHIQPYINLYSLTWINISTHS